MTSDGMGGDLSGIVGRLRGLQAAVAGAPVLRWATVVQSHPLRVRLYGDADALDGVPATAVPVLLPGERVVCVRQNLRVIVVAVAGRFGDVRGTTADMTMLDTSGIAVEGMRFFNTDDSREYVFNGTIWVDPRTLPVQGRIPSSVEVGAGTASVADDGSVSFINASAVSLNGVFDGLGQDMYDIFIELSSSGGAYTGIYTRMRSAGVDHSSALYNYVARYNGNSVGPARYSVFGAAMAGYLNPGLGGISPIVNARMFMTNPGTPIATTFILQTTVAALDRYLCHEYGELSSAVVCDGFSIRPTAGLLSGTIKVVKLS